MQTKEKLTKILDESIFRMEISDPTIVWFSERLEWLVQRLLDSGVVIPDKAEVTADNKSVAKLQIFKSRVVEA